MLIPTEKRKRVRAANFTGEEVNLLIRLALREKHMLESKQTDSEVWKLKTKTWEKIAEVFNASSGQTFRSVETLRLKYDSLKKELEKKVIKNKAEASKTGGGVADYVLIHGPEKELLEVLSLSIHGLPSIFDSDRALPQTTATGEKDTEGLKDIPIITSEEIESYDQQPVIIEVTDVKYSRDLEEGNSSTTPDFIASESVTKNDEVKKQGSSFAPEFKACEIVVNVKDKIPNKNSTMTWKDWSPDALKSNKHPILTPRKNQNAYRNKKIDDLLQLREELVIQQIQHVKQNARRAQEKHEMEMKLLEIEINIKQKSL